MMERRPTKYMMIKRIQQEDIIIVNVHGFNAKELCFTKQILYLKKDTNY
jgi:hypothetical protein